MRTQKLEINGKSVLITDEMFNRFIKKLKNNDYSKWKICQELSNEERTVWCPPDFKENIKVNHNFSFKNIKEIDENKLLVKILKLPLIKTIHDKVVKFWVKRKINKRQELFNIADNQK